MYHVLSITSSGNHYIFDLVDEFDDYDAAVECASKWKENGLEREPFIEEVN